MMESSKNCIHGEAFLPRKVVDDIAETHLPPGISISVGAKQSISDAATIFVSYLTRLAIWQNIDSNGQSLKAEHVLAALKENGMERFLPMLQESLAAYHKKPPTIENGNGSKS